jgi:hypothetical protein
MWCRSFPLLKFQFLSEICNLGWVGTLLQTDEAEMKKKIKKSDSVPSYWAQFGHCRVQGTGRGSSPPPPLRVAKPGRNHLNEEFTPLLPTWIGERF